MKVLPFSAQFIDALINQQQQVHCFMTSGIKLTGVLLAQDDEAILMGGLSQQLVYKHAISTIIKATNHHKKHQER